MKVCGCCHENKPLSEYHRDHSRADGYVLYCKGCRKKYRNGVIQRYTEPRQPKPKPAPKYKHPKNVPDEQLRFFTKVCTQCHQQKTLDNFHKKAGGRYGRKAVCAICESKRSAEFRVDNPEYMKSWQDKNREYVRIKCRADRERRAQENETRERERQMAIITDNNNEAS